ncbi:hypothetical protein Tco_0758176, partial [Tanacetum coccineum]
MLISLRLNLDENVVNFALEGLPTKYDNVYGIIVHREPFPDHKTICSMLTTEEMRLKSRAQDTFIDFTSSSHMVLLANFGSCRFGEHCKFLHNGVYGNGNPSLWSTSVPRSTVPPSLSLTQTDMVTLTTLLEKLGIHETTTSTSNSIVPNSTRLSSPSALHAFPIGSSPPGLPPIPRAQT